MAAIASLTVDDFERLSDDQAHNHELIDGELVAMSGGTLEHNGLRDFLLNRLYSFVTAGRLGTVIAEQEYDFAGNAHGPDVSFFGSAKRPLVDRKKRVQRFVPDLAIEIVSTNDTFEALWRKKERYRACGTAEVWIFAPASQEVLVFSERGDRILRGPDELATPLLPGFAVTVAELFAEMWPDVHETDDPSSV